MYPFPVGLHGAEPFDHRTAPERQNENELPEPRVRDGAAYRPEVPVMQALAGCNERGKYSVGQSGTETPALP